MQVTKQLRTETGHRLVNYDGRCAHLHGHSYLWEVTMTAPSLDNRQMVMDFKDLKQVMHEVLDPLDHCMVLAPNDPLNMEYELNDLFIATNGKKPRVRIWHENPTAESFAEWAAKEIDAKFIVESVIRVRVWETATSYAEWNK